MPQRTRGRLVTAIFAVGLVGGLALGSPSALAEPEPPPPPPAPVDPAAAAPPPPMRHRPTAAARPAAAVPPPPPMRRHRCRRRRPNCRRLSRRPIRWRLRPRRLRRRTRSRRADPLAAPPLPIPEGTPAGQNPTPFVGEPVFLPPSFNPVNGSMVGVAKPIYHQLPAADRQPADGRTGDPHLVDPAGARQVLLGQRHPGALAAPGLLAGEHRCQHRRVRRQIQLPGRRIAGGDHRQQEPPDGNHAQRQVGEDLPGVDGQEGCTTPPTAPTTCSRSSPTS